MAEMSPCVLFNTSCKHISTEMKRKRKTAMHTAEDEKDKSRKVGDIRVEQSNVSRRFKSASVCGSEWCVLSKRMQDRVYNVNPRSRRLTTNH